MVEVMKIIRTSFKRSVPQTLQQATTDSCLQWRLLDTHRQVWLSFLWGHCSFLLGSGAHKLLFVPSKRYLFDTHVHGQRSPSKMVGIGAAVVWCLSDFEGKGEAQKNGRRGETMFRIRFHTHQRRSEDSNKPCAH